MPFKEQEGTRVPSYASAAPTYTPCLRSTLRTSCAWVVLPAIAIAVSLGVTLPARAQTTIPSGNATVNLSNAGYGGATSFGVPFPNTINAAAGNGIYGDNTQSWTLTNQGHVTGAANGVQLEAGSTVINSGSIVGVSYDGVRLQSGGDLINSGTASSISGYYTGISVAGGASVTNEGTITGGTGIQFADGFDNILVNNGSIKGTGGQAVAFGNGADLLQIGNGAYFYGTVNGGTAGTNIMEFLGSSGTLSGYASFVNFQGLTITGSQDWTFLGNLEFQEDLTVAGTLTNNYSIYISHDSTLTIDGAGSMFNNGILGLDRSTLTNNGYFSNIGAIYTSGTTGHPSLITNNGLFINDGYIGICDCTTFTNAGSLLNTARGYISGSDVAIVVTGTASSVTNYGSIYGANRAIYGGGASATITNTGYIASYHSTAIDLSSGVITNGNASYTNALITSHDGDAIQLGTGEVVNYGTIGSYTSGIGINLGGTGTITNRGDIYGATGIVAYSSNAADTAIIHNYGAISGTTGPGVYITGIGLNGTIVNYAGGAISGDIGVEARRTNLTNSGSITGTGNYGVVLEGTLDNQAGGVITGGQVGVYLDRNSSNVTNSGLIQGGSGAGILVSAIGYLSTTVTNTGTIIGGSGTAIAFGRGDDLLQIGAGSSITGGVDGYIGSDKVEFIAGANSSFGNFTSIETLQVDSGATWTNIGTLSVPTLTNAGSLVNAGFISNTVTLTGAGTLTNQAGATMSGATYAVLGNVSSGGGVSISNSGALVGSYSGIQLTDGGHVTNTGTAAYIYGGTVGVIANGAAATITNASLIQGGATGLKMVAGGYVLNQGSAARITGGSYGIYGADITLVNQGNISGNHGVRANGHNSLSNSGTISAQSYGTGVYFTDASTVTNSGLITSSHGTALNLATGSVNNLSGGHIYGAQGVIASYGVSVTNAGVIGNAGTATVAGINSRGTLTVINNAGGTIQGALRAVYAAHGGNSITNDGTVISDYGAGVSLGDGGNSVANSGLISGQFEGVYVAGGAVSNTGTITGNIGVSLGSYGFGSTLTNGGTIIGTGGGAVVMSNGNDTLRILPGAVFQGGVSGGGGSNTLAFIGTGGTLGGTSDFTQFQNVVFDTDSSWTFTGSQTFSTGVALGNAGTLTNAGTLDLYNSDSHALTNSGTFINQGMLAGSILDTGLVGNSGSIGGQVVLYGGAVLDNQAGGHISGGYGAAVYGAAGGIVVTNAGTIDAAYNGSAVNIFHGGSFTNSGTASLVAGNRYGIDARGTASFITNQGTITASNYGVYLRAGGTLTNSGTASSISNALFGVRAVGYDSPVLVTNEGTIAASNGVGVFLRGDGTVSNSGEISGNIGVYIVGATSATVINSGTISGGGYSPLALQFVGFGDLTLVVEPGAEFNGAVFGGFGSHNSLVFAGSGGTLTGNSNFYSFQNATIANGSDWTFAGTGTFNYGVTLSNAGLLTNTGSLYFPSSFVPFFNSGTFQNNGYFQGGIADYGLVGNSGSIAGAIGLLGSGVLDNQAGGVITADGAFAVFGHGSGVSLSNAGTIEGGQDSVYFDGGGTIGNSGLISGSVTAVIFTSNGAGTLSNSGTLTSTYNDVLLMLGGGTISNQGLIQAIADSAEAIYLRGSGTITNSGTVAGGTQGNGIRMNNAGQISNSGKISGGQYGIFAYAPGSVISNSGTILGTDVAGVAFGSGSISNTGVSAAISGGRYGIMAFGGGGLSTTISNQGTISSAAGTGILMRGDGVITNSGTASLISGYYQAIHAYSGTVVVTNSGTIEGTGGYGHAIRIEAGTVTNSGAASLIQGGVEVGRYGAVTNQGTIAGGAYADAIAANSGVTVTNSGLVLATGTNATGIYLYGNGLVTNTGTVQASGALGTGVILYYGGTLNNRGLVSATGASGVGAYAYGPTSISNSGVIQASGDIGTGVELRYGAVATNTGTILASGTSGTGIYAYGGAQIVNSGTVQSTGGTGIYLYGGGTISNTGTASRITGGFGGILTTGGSSTITNQGTVSGVIGVGLAGTNDSLTNSGLASTITGSFVGVLSYSSGVLITNQGAISGAVGVGLLGSGNTLTNSGTAAQITGSYAGVISYASAARITNQGTINGQIGVLLSGAGDVLNNSGAASLITGTNGGVVSYGSGSNITNQGTIRSVIGVAFNGTGGDTLTNKGTIIGTSGTAVQFGSGDDLLIIQPGAVFTGVADGGAGANMLEFAGVNQIPDFTKFPHFGGAKLDAGTTWTINSAQSFPSGMTITNAGTLINNSSLSFDGAITNTGLFTNAGTVNGGIIANSGSLGNSGLIAGGTYGVTGGGTISNSGTITGSNTGVYLSNGSLSNTGLIQGGTYGVQLGAGATLSNSGVIKDDAIAGASLGTNSSFTNNAGSTLSGVTGVVFTGTGASLTNNGTITGSGGIAIQFGAGANTVTLGTTSVVNGTINGGGGAGRIVLNGTGSLGNSVSNFGTGSSLTVSSGASWSVGNMTIGAVTNNGTLSLGATPATVTLNGNFTQSSSGVLNAVLDNGGGSSRILVTGTAALDGTLNIVMPTMVGAPIKYTLISASGGLTGTFSSFNADTVLLSSVLSYDANDAYVTVAQRKLTAPAGVSETQNQFAVASGFDAGVPVDPVGFGPVLGAFNALNAAGFISTLNQMSGEQLVDVSTTSLLAGRQFLGQLQQHARLGAQAPGTWALWGQGFGQSGRLDGDGNTHDLNQGLSGVMVGADVGITSSFRLGGALGFAGGHFNVAGGLGGGRMDYTQIAMTGSYGAGALYIDGTLGGVFGAGTSRRDVTVGTTVNHATAHLDTSQVIGALEAGYRLSLDESVSVTPFARIQTGSVGREALRESGAGILNLAAAHQDSVSTQSILGARLATGLPLGELLLGVDASIGWSHELADAARMARLSFAGTAGTDFIMTGASLSRDGADIGLGFSLPVFGRGQASLRYDGNYGGNGASHAVGLGLRFGW